MCGYCFGVDIDGLYQGPDMVFECPRCDRPVVDMEVVSLFNDEEEEDDDDGSIIDSGCECC